MSTKSSGITISNAKCNLISVSFWWKSKKNATHWHRRKKTNKRWPPPIDSFSLPDSGRFCGRHWDHLLCWPLSKTNQTLAIPCNASRSFVEIIIASRPTIRTEEIPGTYAMKKLEIMSQQYQEKKKNNNNSDGPLTSRRSDGRNKMGRPTWGKLLAFFLLHLKISRQ